MKQGLQQAQFLGRTAGAQCTTLCSQVPIAHVCGRCHGLTPSRWLNPCAKLRSGDVFYGISLCVSIVCESSFKKPFPSKKQQPSLATAALPKTILYFNVIFSLE